MIEEYCESVFICKWLMCLCIDIDGGVEADDGDSSDCDNDENDFVGSDEAQTYNDNRVDGVATVNDTGVPADDDDDDVDDDSGREKIRKKGIKK